jgi:hypothetical protein
MLTGPPPKFYGTRDILPLHPVASEARRHAYQPPTILVLQCRRRS